MVTSVLPDIEDLTPAELQTKACDYWLAGLALGEKLSDAKLGEKFGRSPRWGRYRIAEAKRQLAGELDLSPEESPSLPSTEPMTAPSPLPVVTAVSTTPPSLPPVTAVPHREAAAAPVPVPVERQTLPATRATRIWPVWLLMVPAAVAIWSGWVGLGELAGFGPVRLLPGIADNFEVNSAITLPIGMETYAAYALYVWLSGKAVGKALRFARRSAVAALVVGALGQVAYHVMAAAGVAAAPWWITAGVACLPVAVLGMGAALAHMVRAEHDSIGTAAAAAV